MLAHKLYYFSSVHCFPAKWTWMWKWNRYLWYLQVQNNALMIQNCWVMFCQKQFQDFKFRCVWENDVLWVVGQLVYFVCLHQTNTDISGTINMKLNCLTIGIRQKHIELYERKPLHDLKIKFYKANSDFLHCISYLLDWFSISLITWMTNKYILSVSETVLYQLYADILR